MDAKGFEHTSITSLRNDRGYIYWNLKSDKSKLINWLNTCTHVFGYYNYLPTLQFDLVYPRWQPPEGHTPVIWSHGWLTQLHVSAQLFPNFPNSHSTN